MHEDAPNRELYEFALQAVQPDEPAELKKPGEQAEKALKPVLLPK